jgi:hypothetical protein
MGYNNTATTITLTAKLTPTGREKLLLTNNNLVTSFALGDSDANYYAANSLTTGQVPSNSGNIGTYSSASNSVSSNVNIKSFLTLDNIGTLLKSVESDSNSVTLEYITNGESVISGSSLVQKIINRDDLNTDSLTNLYYSFGLPLNSSQDSLFTATTYSNGGFSDTALSGIAQSKILTIALNNAEYGELIDGKSIKVELSTTASTYTLYSTFQDTGLPKQVQESSYVDSATNTKFIGNNIAFLFSDSISTPNGGNPSLSWSTGYNTVKPYSINNKSLYNLQTNSNVSVSADTIVGIAYLDKGFIVITHPTIVNNFDTTGITSTGTVITIQSASSLVAQNITCIANRGEFNSSTNQTFSQNDTPRISEVALYDADQNLIAIAKTDRHILKGVNEFLALGIKINL